MSKCLQLDAVKNMRNKKSTKVKHYNVGDKVVFNNSINRKVYTVLAVQEIGVFDGNGTVLGSHVYSAFIYKVENHKDWFSCWDIELVTKEQNKVEVVRPP